MLYHVISCYIMLYLIANHPIYQIMGIMLIIQLGPGRQATQPQLRRWLSSAAGRRPCVPGRSGGHLGRVLVLSRVGGCKGTKLGKRMVSYNYIHIYIYVYNYN